MRTLRSILRAALDRVAPPVVDTALADAESWSPDEPDAYCPRCGVTRGVPVAPDPAYPCPNCEGRRFPWRRLTRVGAYDEPLNAWLRAMKFAKRWVWASWFGKQLAAAVPEPEPEDHGRVWVVPVPMPWPRRWRRGYNQADLIAKALADCRGWPVAPLLHRQRYAPPQTSVAPSRRRENTSEAFGCADVDLSGHRFVVVDDILTTGSTLRACSRALRARGATHIETAVVAVADPKDRRALEP